MSLSPQLPDRKPGDQEFVHIRCLIANIHRPKNVSMPPSVYMEHNPPLEAVQESPQSSDTERSERSGSERSEDNLDEHLTPQKRTKSNSFAGDMLVPPGPVLQGKRRRSFLPLHIGTGVENSSSPVSAGPHFNVPKFTVTAPPGEQRRFSHGFVGAFHGFALRRHSNTSLHRSESMVSLACFRTLSQLANSDNTADLQHYLNNNKNVIIDDRDENGTTALMCAADNGRDGAVRLLLDAGADAAAADADGWTSLAFAARSGHLDIARELVDAGANVDSRDCGGWTPLMWASYKGHEDLVAFLLENGADVHAHGNYNINSLVWAAGRRHSGVVQRLLAAGARANSCDKYATSALTWAARAGDVIACTALLSAGADPNTAGMYCWTPLLQAVHGNHSEIVQVLLEHKPNVNALDKDGYTALAIACKEGYYDNALALINSGAYINVQDHSKDTPLIHAVKGGHKNIVEALLKKHVDVDLPGKERKTPVYTAVEKGHLSILKLLLASNPDLEHTTMSGDTPLMRAVRSRNAEMVQLLLEKKARVNVADNRGDTCLHIAMRARSKQIVEILLRNPKNSQLLYKPNKLNETPYNIDMSYNKTILGQIFGARKLNTNEDNENMLGYELYSAALADMLSEPSLSVPITVGLYARWGSGKSFLLNKLKEEMKNFARQWSDAGWQWSWAVWWGAWHVALAAGALVAAAGADPVAAVSVCFTLFAAIYVALYALWYLGNKYEWWWAGGVLSALGRRFSSLLLVLQVMFCHPPGPNDPRALPATPIRFHFTEGMKSGGGQEGEAMVVQMIASLAEALECQYGRVCTRLARAFRPKPVSASSGWRWRKVCCIPHIITFEFCFTCILLGMCVLAIFLTENNVDQQRRAVQQGLMYGACVVGGACVLANLYTWGRVLAALVLPPRARLQRARAAAAPAQALRPQVQALTHIVSCLDAFTGQQTRLVVVVDALDSCEQEKVLALLNAVHALCSDPKSPFILLLAIDPHIISKAVEVNSRRAFSESNIGGWDYLRNMVQLPFYLQNSALRRVKTAQVAAQRRLAAHSDDLCASLQRSVSARRLSSTSELMSSQERIKNQPKEAPSNSVLSARTRRLRPSESVASSVASGLHRAVPPAGAADLSRVLLTDDYFSDVNPRSMRRLMNVLYVTGRLLKAFQIEFNWYQLASWVNLTEQWPFRTSWIIYHHETYEDHIDDSTSLKHIYEKVKPLMSGLREASALLELDRDERKLDVFLSFHRATLTAADLKIFLPFTINLDPYIKKVIKEEQLQSGLEEELGGGATAGLWGSHTKLPHSKLFHRRHRASPPSQPSGPGGAVPVPPMWVGWTNTGASYPQPVPHYPPPVALPATNPYHLLKTAFPALGEVSSLRLSSLSVERVCGVARAALGARALPAVDALTTHRVCGLALAACNLEDLQPVLNLPFGDWELFKLLIINLRELEANMPFTAPSVTVVADKPTETEPDSTKRTTIEHQRSRPSNVEKQPYAEYQVTLEEQMICGALQTLNEEAMEDVLQSEPPSHPDEEATLQLAACVGEPPTDSILKRGGSFRRRAPADTAAPPPAVTFNVEDEERSDDDDGQITFSARPRPAAHYRPPPADPAPSPPRSRPASLLASEEEAGGAPLTVRSRSAEDSSRAGVGSPVLDLKLRGLRKTAAILRKVSSAERLTRLKDKIMSRGGGGGGESRERSPARDEPASDDESAPLVSGAVGGAPLAVSCGPADATASAEVSPRSDLTELESPREPDASLELVPRDKGGGAAARADLHTVEPYNPRLVSEARALWRQDALDASPPWPWDEPDSPV